jgi:uncharacterized membrane protein YphA (DoxX/SURF4 family)
MAVAAAVIVGIVLVVSGALKLASPSWPAQARRLGTPGWLVPVVPVVEIVLGALVATGVASPGPAWAAVAVLAGFTALLVAHLARGDRPPCACFGRLSERPISWWSVARNVVLITLALLAALA